MNVPDLVVMFPGGVVMTAFATGLVWGPMELHQLVRKRAKKKRRLVRSAPAN